MRDQLVCNIANNIKNKFSTIKKAAMKTNQGLNLPHSIGEICFHKIKFFQCSNNKNKNKSYTSASLSFLEP